MIGVTFTKGQVYTWPIQKSDGPSFLKLLCLSVSQDGKEALMVDPQDPFKGKVCKIHKFKGRGEGIVCMTRRLLAGLIDAEQPPIPPSGMGSPIDIHAHGSSAPAPKAPPKEDKGQLLLF